MLLQPVLGLAENGIEPDKTTKNVPRRMYSYHRTDVKLNFQFSMRSFCDFEGNKNGTSSPRGRGLGSRPALNPEELNLREIPSIGMRTNMWR